MSNTGWIILGVIMISLFLVIGIYLYQQSKNEAESLRQQKLLGLQSSLAISQKRSGPLGFILDVLNTEGVKAAAPMAAKIALI